MEDDAQFFDRDLSWLSFNERVLQEANDESVPLYERLRFLAIYSSNLDEFFRVRVASLKGLNALKKKKQKKLGVAPKDLLKEIHDVVVGQQTKFGKIYRRKIQKELESHNIFLIEKLWHSSHQAFVQSYYHEHVKSLLMPGFIHPNQLPPFLHNKKLYFAIKLLTRERLQHLHHAILEIPTDELGRFVALPSIEDRHFIMFLDDVIRHMLHDVFPAYEIAYAHAIKLTRDAELYINDEFSGDLKEKILKGIAKRKTGAPSRFLYDAEMPRDMLQLMMEIFSLDQDDTVIGGRYHNFSDFFKLPNPLSPKLEYERMPPLSHHTIKKEQLLFDQITQRDILLHFPYQSYRDVLRFLDEAAKDEHVLEINITLYRVKEKDSKVVGALLKALSNQKKVTVFIEVKARFDEERNFYWAKELERNGAEVLYSIPGWKVHAKLCVVKRRENQQIVNYAYLGTGNFNEKTAKLYTDHALLTKDSRLIHDAEKVFDILRTRVIDAEQSTTSFSHLLVAPYALRNQFEALIDEEITHAKNGFEAYIYLKMNSLEDTRMIQKLYQASQAGVKIHLMVRGICRLKPGIEGLSETIKIYSVIDRFLEHGRTFLFSGGGREKLFLGSADWMTRNLSRRVEVVFPVYDPALFKEMRAILMIQFSDNQKARLIDSKLKNKYRKPDNEEKPIRSQSKIYEFLKNTDY